MFEVNSGAIMKAKKTVLYGPEGIGKSSLAAMFPNPIFIDTEGSTDHMENVNRLKPPSSYTELIQMIDWVKQNKQYSTLVIDTADWAQTLIEKHVLVENGWASIEAPGYGEGYVKSREKWGNMLDKLTDVVNAGINVVLTAHSEIRKFDDPTESGSYDRYELKLTKRSNAHIAGVTKEWADMVLFLNYKVMSVKRDGMGEKFQAQGGQRKMFTTHHPAYDAKNRFSLPDELPLDYSHIAHVIPDLVGPQTMMFDPQEVAPDAHVQQVEVTPRPVSDVTPEQLSEDLSLAGTAYDDNPVLPPYLPAELADLMMSSKVTVDELTGVMGLRGHYPINTSFETIASTSPDYFRGGLAANWEMVLDVVKSIRLDPSQLIDLYSKVGETNPEEKVQSLNIRK